MSKRYSTLFQEAHAALEATTGMAESVCPSFFYHTRPLAFLFWEGTVQGGLAMDTFKGGGFNEGFRNLEVPLVPFITSDTQISTPSRVMSTEVPLSTHSQKVNVINTSKMTIQPG